MFSRCSIAGIFGAMILAATSSLADSGATLSTSGSFTLIGGFSYRNAGLYTGSTQALDAVIRDVSPTLVALRADWYLLPWLGVEGEALGDFFVAVGADEKFPVRRREGRIGPALRWPVGSGFSLNGSLGFGISSAPVIRYATLDAIGFPDALISGGLSARVAGVYTTSRFEGTVGLAGLMSPQVSTFEPRIWLGVRALTISATDAWLGIDSSLRVESSLQDSIHYRGFSIHVGLGLKLVFNATSAKNSPTDQLLRVRVQSIDGDPIRGSTLIADAASPQQTDDFGVANLLLSSGPHTLSASHQAYRSLNQSIVVHSAAANELVLKLIPKTGPGQLAGRVTAATTLKPVEGASIHVGGGAPIRTDAEGRFRVASAGPGPVALRIDASGYSIVNEVIQIAPETETTFDAALDVLGRGSPAVIRGLIRSLTGATVQAQVTIRGSRVPVKVTPEGRFSINVPGGQYTLEFSAPGFVTQVETVSLADGDQTVIHVELQQGKP